MVGILKLKDVYKWNEDKSIKDGKRRVEELETINSLIIEIKKRIKKSQPNINDSIIDSIFNVDKLVSYTDVKSSLTNDINKLKNIQWVKDALLLFTIDLYINPISLLLKKNEQNNEISDEISDEILTNHLSEVLKVEGNLSVDNINLLLEKKEAFKKAFTHWTVNNENNILWDTLGDKIINKAIIYYLFRRFPNLRHTPTNSKIITDSMKKYTSIIYVKLFNSLKLDEIVKYKPKVYLIHPFNSIDRINGDIRIVSLEDDMKESFIKIFLGVLECNIDNKITNGFGSTITYNIISKILDKENI